MKVIYIVSIGYKNFSFSDPSAAMSFATIAKQHYYDEHDVNAEVDVVVKIEIKLQEVE